ncbi:MAG: RNA-binding S4 domain-containing protein [Snodgrassella sp.]|nr:RNA-binding S4 domain-containing protein [Snodgrassella sp.]
MKQQFNLDGHPHIALCDLLKLTGLVESGGRAKQLISEGLVRRNGQIETRKTAKIMAGESIQFEGHEIDIINQTA